MTKGGGFPLRASGHDRADCHWAIGDDDTITQECDPWSALRKGQRMPRRPETGAEGLEALGQRGHLDLWLRLRRQWAQVMGQALWGVGHLLRFAFDLVAADAGRQRDLQAPRVEGVREPRTA